MDDLFSQKPSRRAWHNGRRYDSVPNAEPNRPTNRRSRFRAGRIAMRSAQVRPLYGVSVAAKLSAGVEMTEIRKEKRIAAMAKRREKQREEMMEQMKESQQMKMMEQMSNMSNGGGGGMIGGCFKTGEHEACKVIGMVCCGLCCVAACIAFAVLCCKQCCGCLTDCLGDCCGSCKDMCGSCTNPIADLFGSLGDTLMSPFKSLGSILDPSKYVPDFGSIASSLNPFKMLAHPLRNYVTVQSHTASVPSHWRFVAATLPIFATGILILMSFQIGSNHPAAIAAEQQFCQELRMSIDFGTTKMFDSAIDSLLPGCYTTKMDVLENSYHYSCIDSFGRNKYTDTEMRDTIMSGIRWASTWSTATDYTNSTSTLIQSTVCNSTSGEGYYTLDGTHLRISEVCRYIHIFSEVSGVATTSLLHDLHDLHIPGCKGSHAVVLSRTFEENCLPAIPT